MSFSDAGPRGGPLVLTGLRRGAAGSVPADLGCRRCRPSPRCCRPRCRVEVPADLGRRKTPAVPVRPADVDTDCRVGTRREQPSTATGAPRKPRPPWRGRRGRHGRGRGRGRRPCASVAARSAVCSALTAQPIGRHPIGRELDRAPDPQPRVIAVRLGEVENLTHWSPSALLPAVAESGSDAVEVGRIGAGGSRVPSLPAFTELLSASVSGRVPADLGCRPGRWPSAGTSTLPAACMCDAGVPRHHQAARQHARTRDSHGFGKTPVHSRLSA